ncbi:GNAT family N-acetyltransferase [Marivirga arenosa]|uniref:GNAT family N-acetyltransferase n=1 Tax=Marivirga arenosa TaxID=3059076 RepID=A0AA49GF39_9BACT|nr:MULTISPECIES: GNAT family N-acetyltransferase [unclassified Marivirga]WKK83170.2 GNAT family N-acetyltransferase [Marivirga sp. BKB1-2]WKK86374.1 GNAT family N-acetyltransferase [Marivirga sp. ABR2-2]
MENIRLRKATNKEKLIVVDIDYRLDKNEHIKLNREEKITKAISRDECFLILSDHQVIGFLIFDYRFFDQGWIELIIIDEKYRGKGIGGKVFDLLCEKCRTDKIFTSTNSSNTRMQKALTKANFSFAGKLNGLDDGDPELFYYKKLIKSKTD